MKYLLSILCLFVFSCDGGDVIEFEPIYGCTDNNACNFNSNATIFDNSCIYESEDCLGICGGNNTLDECGICDNNLTNNCVQDECGIWGGNGSSCNPLIRGYVYNNSGAPVENAYIFLGYEITTRPATTIQFSLTESSYVSMWVENECDEIVSTLFENEYYESGVDVTVIWDGSNSDGLMLLDGVYEINTTINDDIASTNIILLKHPPNNGYEQQFCFDDNGQLLCEHIALTNSDGYFEFSQNCISLGYEYQGVDENGIELGNQFLSRLRLFADNGQEYGTSNYFEVDTFNGAETTIIVNR